MHDSPRSRSLDAARTVHGAEKDVGIDQGGERSFMFRSPDLSVVTRKPKSGRETQGS